MSETVLTGGTPGAGLQVSSAILQGPVPATCKDSRESTYGMAASDVPHGEISGLFRTAGVKNAAVDGRITPVSGVVASLQGPLSCDWAISDLQGGVVA